MRCVIPGGTGNGAGPPSRLPTPSLIGESPSSVSTSRVIHRESPYRKLLYASNYSEKNIPTTASPRQQAIIVPASHQQTSNAYDTALETQPPFPSPTPARTRDENTSRTCTRTPVPDRRPGTSQAVQTQRDPRHYPSPPIAPGSLHLHPRIHLPTPEIPPNKMPDLPPVLGPGHLHKQGSNESMPNQVNRTSKRANPSVFAPAFGLIPTPVPSPRIPLGIETPGADIGPHVPASAPRAALRETEKGVTVS